MVDQDTTSDTTPLRIPDAAERLNISTHKARELIRRGELPAFVVGPRMTRVLPAAVEKFIASHPAVVEVGNKET